MCDFHGQPHLEEVVWVCTSYMNEQKNYFHAEGCVDCVNVQYMEKEHSCKQESTLQLQGLPTVHGLGRESNTRFSFFSSEYYL